jgi:hypothetical protein
MLAFNVACTALMAQTDTAKKDVGRIRAGMNEAMVRKVAGNPEIIEQFKTVKKGTRDTSTYWRYEDDLTVIFRRHIVEAIEKDHAALLRQIQEWADPKNKDGIKLLYK